MEGLEAALEVLMEFYKIPILIINIIFLAIYIYLCWWCYKKDEYDRNMLKAIEELKQKMKHLKKEHPGRTTIKHALTYHFKHQ